MPDYHAKPVLAVRVQQETRDWAHAEAKRRGQSFGDFIDGLVAAERGRVANHVVDQQRAIAASPGPPRRSRKPRTAKPESAPEAAPPRRRCTHPGRARVIGGYCPACDHLTEPGGYWRD